MIMEPPKIKSDTVSTLSPCISHEFSVDETRSLCKPDYEFHRVNVSMTVSKPGTRNNAKKAEVPASGYSALFPDLPSFLLEIRYLALGNWKLIMVCPHFSQKESPNQRF